MTTSPTFGFYLEYVTDIEASRRFYVEVMGLKEERYHRNYVQFEHFAIASDESVGGSNEPEVYWLVDDIDAAHREMSSQTGPSEIRDLPFGRVFTVTDPAGSVRYLLEFAKQRPSEAV